MAAAPQKTAVNALENPYGFGIFFVLVIVIFVGLATHGWPIPRKIAIMNKKHLST